MSGRALRWAWSLVRPGRRDPGPRLVIVRHHRVLAQGERPLYRLGVTEAVFEAQLAMLAGLAGPPVTVREGLRLLAEGAPGTRVALTFDDGYADNVTRALPRLEAVGGRATFYLTAGLIERREAPWWDALEHALLATRRPRLAATIGGVGLDLPLAGRADRGRALRALLPLMRAPLPERERRLREVREALGAAEPAPCRLATWEQARRLAEAGMEVGAHTLDHPHLSLLSENAQREQIEGSVELIGRRLGVRPRGLAYPAGDHDHATLRVAAAAGLEHAVTTRAGDNGPDRPRLELRRRGLSEGACLDPLGRFSQRLARAELEGAFDAMRGVEVPA